MISLVCAMGKNREIGANNRLLWSLPNDMKHFRELTTGGTVIMGRNTHDSIGKTLPNRRNFVITNRLLTTPYDFNGNNDIHNVPKEQVRNIIRFWMGRQLKEELFVIGGQSIYQQFLPFADRLYITSVDGEFPESDTFFPDIDINEWKISSVRFSHPDEKHKYKQVYVVLDK